MPRVVSRALVRRGRGPCGWLCCAPCYALLLRRVSGHWHFHGGQHEFGETDEDALVRETDEEVGVAVAARDLCRVAELVVDGRVVLLYASRRWRGMPCAMEAGTQVRWERVDALDRVGPALPSLRASHGPLVRFLSS
jgi:8-oxo-dGTP pyrophosphatase MutT (NUDIX family)